MKNMTLTSSILKPLGFPHSIIGSMYKLDKEKHKIIITIINI